MMKQIPSKARPQSDPVRIVLVDDAARVRSDLRQLLELSGLVKVEGEAKDGIEAIRLAAELIPDVIVMDLEMPDMNGYEATRHIKSKHPEIVVIILSIHDSPDVKQKAREAGANNFIVKGTSYEKLLGTILGEERKLHSNEQGEIP